MPLILGTALKFRMTFKSSPLSIWICFVNEPRWFTLRADAFRGWSVCLLVASACGVTPGHTFPAGVAALHSNQPV